MKNRQLYRLAACLVGAATLLLQSCSGNRNCDRLCGSWSSVEGKPDVLIYKEGDAYKVTVFSRSGRTRRLKPETYLLQREENGNLYMALGRYNGSRGRSAYPSAVFAARERWEIDAKRLG